MEYHDVILVNPPMTLEETFENLGLSYIAACLRKRNIDVKILNFPQWPVPMALKELKKYSCKIIGVSVPFQPNAGSVFNFISGLKNQGLDAHITIGSIFPTFAYEEILRNVPAIDSVVLGEGEDTFVELAGAVINSKNWRDVKGIAYRKNGEIVKTEPRPLIQNLDTIPFPERDILPEVLRRIHFAPVLSSRGCYGRCSFCSVVPFYSSFGPKYRLRSSENVVEELELLHNKFGVKNVEFNDANFIGGKGRGSKRAEEIAEKILERKMDLRFSMQCRPNDVDEGLFKVLKKAGLSKVFLGVESGSQSMLDRFKKDVTVEENVSALRTLKKLDLVVFMGYITFDDRITSKEFKETLKFLLKAISFFPPNKFSVDAFNKLIPLAGTEIERHLKETKKYKGHSLSYTYKLDNPAIDLFYNIADTFANTSLGLRKALNIRDNYYTKRWTKI